MAKTYKSFKEISASRAANPTHRARVEEYKRAMRHTLALAELRERLGRTQAEVASALATSQPNVSRIEHEENIYVSTLRGYVEALGGQLEINAVFPDQVIEIGPGELRAHPRAQQPVTAMTVLDAVYTRFAAWVLNDNLEHGSVFKPAVIGQCAPLEAAVVCPGVTTFIGGELWDAPRFTALTGTGAARSAGSLYTAPHGAETTEAQTVGTIQQDRIVA